MSFEVEHEKWLKRHLKKRKGQRLDALKKGHGYGNQLFAKGIWWKLFGHFNGLYPEFEILDWRGFPFYADFVWIIGTIRIVFEIQDFGSHVQAMDRTGYRRELNRGMFMTSLQYKIVYISLDELKENPALVLFMIQTILAPYLVDVNRNDSTYSKLERDLMRISVRNNRTLRPLEAAKQLVVTPKTIIKHMQYLVEKGKFRAIPAGLSGRVNRYEYIGPILDPDLF